MATGVAVEEYIVIVHAQQLIEDNFWFPDKPPVSFFIPLYELRMLIDIIGYILLV
jgi:hypothetical protein